MLKLQKDLYTGWKMDPIAIYLKEYFGFPRTGEPLSFGIPLPCSQLRDTDRLRLLDLASQEPIPASFTPLCLWHDGSVRWVKAECLTNLQPGQHQTLSLDNHGPCETTERYFVRARNGWIVRTKAGNYLLTISQPNWEFSNSSGPALFTRAQLNSRAEAPGVAIADCDWQLHQNGAVYVEALLKGHWQEPDQSTLCRFHCQLRIYLETGLADVEFRIHNPKRAKHYGGLWDLGDKGSIYFQSLELITETSSEAVTLQPDLLHNPEYQLSSSELWLYQDSSGGDNWTSLNHIDNSGNLTTHFQGYKLRTANQTEHTGKRANPQLTIHGDSRTQIAMPGFWQNFPSSLSYKDRAAIAGLFPPQPNNRCYELQGGERKTLRCLFNHSETNNLAWAYCPITPTIDASVYESANALPWFKADVDKDALDELIQGGLDGQSNFFAKREIIDEYGWRNFGDIFADHETLYQEPGEPPLISHYNNQYDAIYGFARQFALTGDRRWFQLMDDLARHVTDIDMYHTDEDRAEYNHGLFWHTDHYLSAHTATHRTFSKHNDTSSIPGQTGGGPAEEHCYSTGLLYHYLLTGCTNSKVAVIDLARWIMTLHEGTNTLLEQLMRMKRYDLPRIASLLKGQRITPHIYLFNRGTGNYINTLLDASILDPEGEWLDQAGAVIKGTIHPGDDINSRNLLDIEHNWSYLVLLTSISRYINIKNEKNEYDFNYQYALASLRHYTRWMARHEAPFLVRSGQMEFANDTWTAQDIRKVMLMYQAAIFDPIHETAYRNKALEWSDNLKKLLMESPERKFTRVQVILLQNYGPHHSYRFRLTDLALSTEKVADLNEPPALSLINLLSRISKKFTISALNCRPSKEKKWLKTRLDG